METFVLGHKNPDMDAICSAIGYAAFKQAVGEENVIAARCGETNERIDYVLRRFGVDAPRFVSSVAPKVEDVMQREVITARAGDPVHIAMRQIGENRFRGLPVVDDAGRCIGLLSGFKLCAYFFPEDLSTGRHREVRTSLADIVRSIGSTVLEGVPSTTEDAYQLIVAAMYHRTFEERLGAMDAASAVLFVGDRYDIHEVAIRAGVPALVLTGGVDAPERTLELAREHGTLLLSAPLDTATTVLLARGSIRADRLLNENFTSLRPEEPLEEARRRVVLTGEFIFPVLDDEHRLVGVVSKSDFLQPVERKLILVDHNELNQAVDGAAQIPITEVIDHHRLDNPPTDAPIFFLNQPVGSTSTIVAERFRQQRLEIPEPIAGCLMAGLISDTLNLTSPTATPLDHEILAMLEEITGVSPTELAEEIFSIGSPLLTMTAEQAVTADCKEYQERQARFSLAQVEELSFSHFPEREEALSEALERYRSANGLLFSGLLVTDVMTQNSILLLRGDSRLAEQIPYPHHSPNAWRLSGVVSRKKQLLPFMIRCLQNIL